jgi:hypothetical protein
MVMAKKVARAAVSLAITINEFLMVMFMAAINQAGLSRISTEPKSLGIIPKMTTELVFVRLVTGVREGQRGHGEK